MYLFLFMEKNVSGHVSKLREPQSLELYQQGTERHNLRLTV